MPIKVNCDFCNNSLDDRFSFLTCSFKPSSITPDKDELNDYLLAISNRFEAVYCHYECLWNELNILAKEQGWEATKEKKDAKRSKK